MRKKILRLGKNKKSPNNKVVKNLIKTKRKPRNKGKRTKRIKKSNKKTAGIFSLTKINFNEAYIYLNELSETYRIYKYILDNCQITTKATDHFGVNLIIDLNITDKVKRRHYITDDRYIAKDIIFENNKPLSIRTEKNRNLSYEHILGILQDLEKYKELLSIVEDCLTNLEKNIREYNILKKAIQNSGIPNIINTMRAPVSDSIKDGRKNYTTQQLVRSNISLSDYYERYLSEIKQDKDKINMNNLAFMEKCKEISNALVLPHREFYKNSIGFPVGKGGGNLFVEFGCLKHILKFDKQIMIYIRDDIRYIIDACKNFFSEKDIDEHLKKRNMQPYFKRNDTGYAPVDFNTTRPGGRYRFIQNMHNQGLQNAFNNDNTGLTVLNPNNLRNRGIYKRGRQSSNSNQFFDALTGSEQN